MQTSIRIVQVTDLHLMVDADATFNEIRPAENARRIFSAICDISPGPDLVVATGDLTNDGEVESYRRLRELADSLPCPVKCAIGNHDVRRSFRAGWEGHSMPDDSPLDHAFDFEGLRIVILDSTIPGEGGGHFEPGQIEWLGKEMAATGAVPKLVFLHHQPIEVGSAWIDRMIVSNADDLFEALAPARESILGIFFGHVHQDFEGQWEGVPVIGTRPTSFQFTPNSERFLRSDEPPGYRVIDIRDGALTSRSVPVPA